MPIEPARPVDAGLDDILPITGEGKLLGFLASHDQAGVQTLTFYDNNIANPGDEIMIVHIAPEQCPFYVMFPLDRALHFTTGLEASHANIELNVWVWVK